MSYSVQEQKILRNNKSGSSEILNSILHYNLEYLKENSSSSDLLEHLVKYNKAVMKKFSAMAIVTNGLNRVNSLIAGSIISKKPAVMLSNNIKRLIKDISRIDKKIIENCSILFPKRKSRISVATYSNSGLVKKVIKKYGKLINKVYLSEARPACEGREMAQCIAGLGIEVNLSTDIHLPGLLSNVDLLLLGADSVGRDRFINKIGTELLVKEAGRIGVKSVVLFESLKIKKLDINTSLKADYDRREILPLRNYKNIEVINQYFELVDNHYISKFISDLGVDSAKSLKRKISIQNLI